MMLDLGLRTKISGIEANHTQQLGQGCEAVTACGDEMSILSKLNCFVERSPGLYCILLPYATAFFTSVAQTRHMQCVLLFWCRKANNFARDMQMLTLFIHTHTSICFCGGSLCHCTLTPLAVATSIPKPLYFGSNMQFLMPKLNLTSYCPSVETRSYRHRAVMHMAIAKSYFCPIATALVIALLQDLPIIVFCTAYCIIYYRLTCLYNTAGLH